jgi:hypothetical protein
VAFGLRAVDRAETVYVALADPYNVPGMDEIRFRLGKTVKFALAPLDEISRALSKALGRAVEFAPAPAQQDPAQASSLPSATPAPAPSVSPLDDLFPPARPAASDDLESLLGMAPPPPSPSAQLDDLLGAAPARPTAPKPAAPSPAPRPVAAAVAPVRAAAFAPAASSPVRPAAAASAPGPAVATSAPAKPPVSVTKFPPSKPVAPPANIVTEPVDPGLDLSSPAEALAAGAAESSAAMSGALELPEDAPLQIASGAELAAELSAGEPAPDGAISIDESPAAAHAGELELTDAEVVEGIELTPEEMLAEEAPAPAAAPQEASPELFGDHGADLGAEPELGSALEAAAPPLPPSAQISPVEQTPAAPEVIAEAPAEWASAAPADWLAEPAAPEPAPEAAWPQPAEPAAEAAPEQPEAPAGAEPIEIDSADIEFEVADAATAAGTAAAPEPSRDLEVPFEGGAAEPAGPSASFDPLAPGPAPTVQDDMLPFELPPAEDGAAAHVAGVEHIVSQLAADPSAEAGLPSEMDFGSAAEAMPTEEIPAEALEAELPSEEIPSEAIAEFPTPEAGEPPATAVAEPQGAADTAEGEARPEAFAFDAIEAAPAAPAEFDLSAEPALQPAAPVEFQPEPAPSGDVAADLFQGLSLEEPPAAPLTDDLSAEAPPAPEDDVDLSIDTAAEPFPDETPAPAAADEKGIRLELEDHPVDPMESTRQYGADTEAEAMESTRPYGIDEPPAAPPPPGPPTIFVDSSAVETASAEKPIKPEDAGILELLARLSAGDPLPRGAKPVPREKIGQALARLLLERSLISPADLLGMLAIPPDKLSSTLVKVLVERNLLNADDLVSMLAIPPERVNASVLQLLVLRGFASAAEARRMLG